MFKALALLAVFFATGYAVRCPVCIGPSCLTKEVPEVECEGDEGVFYRSDTRAENATELSEHQCLHLLYRIPADNRVITWKRCIKRAYVTAQFCPTLLNYNGLYVSECVLSEGVPNVPDGAFGNTVSFLLVTVTVLFNLMH